MEQAKRIRPTKKQFELLDYIQKFIAEKGYGPSYREIASGCNYTSVATVATHINNLIARGHLRKKDHSARSLEVVYGRPQAKKVKSNQIQPAEEKWLIEKIDHQFSQVENSQVSEAELAKLETLVRALRILGLEGPAQAFAARLFEISKTV